MACWQQIKFPVIWLLNYNYWQLRANQINTATRRFFLASLFMHNAARDKRGNPVGDTTFGTRYLFIQLYGLGFRYCQRHQRLDTHSQSLGRETWS
jgi:hypothetical protein